MSPTSSPPATPASSRVTRPLLCAGDEIGDLIVPELDRASRRSARE
jgi:hypothetical protein